MWYSPAVAGNSVYQTPGIVELPLPDVLKASAFEKTNLFWRREAGTPALIQSVE